MTSTNTRVKKQTAEQIIARLIPLLDHIDPDVSYDQWMRVLMVIFYETGDSAEGFELADDWSSMGQKYRGTADVRRTWQYFNPKHPNPVRMGSLVRMVSR